MELSSQAEFNGHLWARAPDSGPAALRCRAVASFWYALDRSTAGSPLRTQRSKPGDPTYLNIFKNAAPYFSSLAGPTPDTCKSSASLRGFRAAISSSVASLKIR